MWTAKPGPAWTACRTQVCLPRRTCYRSPQAFCTRTGQTMEHDLSNRFVFGSNNIDIFTPGTPAHDFFLGIPHRQKVLVNLARAQITSLEAAARAHESSNALIAGELRHLSSHLDLTISGLSGDIQMVGEDIVDAVRELEGSMLAALGELHWTLQQIEGQLSEVILLLKNKRKTEAQELLEQALQNLKHGFYEEAKDRLLEALRFDNTDYQVHRNLGFVFLHADDTLQTLTHFEKALAFAPDQSAKTDSMADLARAHYAAGDYRMAYAVQRDVLSIAKPTSGGFDKRLGKLHYNGSVYAALAGETRAVIPQLTSALRLNPDLLALAAVDRDFMDVRSHVDQFLEQQLKGTLEEAEEALAGLTRLRRSFKFALDNPLSGRIDRRLSAIETSFNQAGHRGLLKIIRKAPSLKAALQMLKEDAAIAAEIQRTREGARPLESELESFRRQEQDETEKRKRFAAERASQRHSRARVVRGLAIPLAYVVCVGLGLLIMGASWKGCMAVLHEGAMSNDMGFFARLGSLILMAVWAIANVVGIPMAFIWGIRAAVEIKERLDDWTEEAKRPSFVSYERPAGHEELIRKLENLRQRVSQLKVDREVLHQRTRALLDSIATPKQVGRERRGDLRTHKRCE